MIQIKNAAELEKMRKAAAISAAALKAGGVFLKFASAIGIGVAAGATASEKTTSSNDELKSTEQLLSNFQLVLEDLKEQGIV